MKLIYLSPVHWSSYKQRPHFMVQSFLAKGVESVLWINPYPARLPRIEDFFREKSLYQQGTDIPPQIFVLSPQMFPVEPLPVVRHVNTFFMNKVVGEIRNYLDDDPFILGIGRPVMLGHKLLIELSPQWSFYDAMDDFPEFYTGLSRNSLKEYENDISEKVDVLFVSSTSLKTKFANRGHDPKLICNACQLPDFKKIHFKTENKNILGYIGVVASWFDWELVCDIAERLPAFRVRIIGPVFNPPGRKLPGNIEVYPPCSHSEIVSHLCQFTAGLIPFKINKLTESVDPIKYYEYRALGIPTMSTKFGEMLYRKRDDGVFFLEKNVCFSTLIKDVCSWVDTTQAVDDTFYYDNCWSSRFSLLEVEMEKKKEQ